MIAPTVFKLFFKLHKFSSTQNLLISLSLLTVITSFSEHKKERKEEKKAEKKKKIQQRGLVVSNDVENVVFRRITH